MTEQFLDLHTHVVYGVDDGARTEEQMRAMLDAAAANGITTLVATPHATPGLEEFPQERYQRHLDAAQAYCQQQGYGLRLYPGAELLYNPMLRDAARENGLPTLAGTDWVLMEFLPQTSAKELENGLEEVAVCGYSILMAPCGALPLPGIAGPAGKAEGPVSCGLPDERFHGAGAGQLLEAAAGGTLAEQRCH